mgnify:CR=1 FL=1
MYLKGSAESRNKLRGSINKLTELRGYSAYEIAVINGFSGTEKEWLASLKGETSDPGGGTTARIAYVNILANKWTGTKSPYSQVVTVEGVTANSQVDLTPSVEQLVIFYEKDLTFVTENDGGVVTVYAIGQKPANDYTIQATVTEVTV